MRVHALILVKFASLHDWLLQTVYCKKKNHVYYCPTTNNNVQNGSLVGIYTQCIHVFAGLASICMLSRCLLTKFLHWNSVRSLLRVRCWLGPLYSKLSSTVPHSLLLFVAQSEGGGRRINMRGINGRRRREKKTF